MSQFPRALLKLGSKCLNLLFELLLLNFYLFEFAIQCLGDLLREAQSLLKRRGHRDAFQKFGENIREGHSETDFRGERGAGVQRAGTPGDWNARL